MIQNVKFRDVWGFVGQKGITGFAEIEQVILHWLLAWTKLDSERDKDSWLFYYMILVSNCLFIPW